jgi:hypothetical protein
VGIIMETEPTGFTISSTGFCTLETIYCFNATDEVVKTPAAIKRFLKVNKLIFKPPPQR